MYGVGPLLRASDSLLAAWRPAALRAPSAVDCVEPAAQPALHAGPSCTVHTDALAGHAVVGPRGSSPRPPLHCHY
eukprot:SAG11_NODE_2683_length_3101_cov_3.117255_2_plen_75_part_00